MRGPRGALLVAALAALVSDRNGGGAQAHYIWLTGESLGAEQPERTAGIVLTERAAGIPARSLMTMFAAGPKQCSVWMTDGTHDHIQLPVAVASVGVDEAVLRSSPFTTAGPFTVEAQCTYGLFGHGTEADDSSGMTVAPPLLMYYSSAQGGASSYADYRTHVHNRYRCAVGRTDSS